MHPRLARLRPLRGPRGAALVALPDRDERLPRHAGRPRAPRPADGPRAGPRADRGEPEHAARGDVDRADPRRPRRAGGRRPGRGRAWRARRSGSRSSPRCSTCRRASAPCSSSARCCAGRRPRSPSCSRRASPRSTARCSGRGRRSTPSERQPRPTTPPSVDEADAELLARYVEAFERYDMEALTSLIHEDATQSMPPFDLWLQRPRRHPHLVVRPGHRLPRLARRSRRVAANGSPAFGQYKPSEAGDGYEPWALQVLEIEDGRIVEFTFFLDTETRVPALRAAARARRVASAGARRAGRRAAP